MNLKDILKEGWMGLGGIGYRGWERKNKLKIVLEFLF